MRRLGMRWLLLWPVLLAVSLGMLALAVYVDRAATTDQIASVDDELVRVQNRVPQPPVPRVGGAGPALGEADRVEPADVVDALVTPVQFVISAEDSGRAGTGPNPFSAEQIESLAGRSGSLTVDGNPRYRVLLSLTSSGDTQVSALPLDQVDASIGSLRTSLVVGGIVIFLFVGLVVLLIASAVTRPVRRMSEAANRIARGELDTKIGEPTGARETAQLAIDLEQMLARLNASLDDSNRLTAEATQARDVMRRFLADASHELRTPLTSMKGYSDLYARDMLDEPGHIDRAMSRVGSESSRLTQLVDDMLVLASAGSMPDGTFDPVNLVDVGGDVVDDLRAAFPNHEIELRGDTDGVSPVLGDRGRLHQCLLNLGSNACHHGGDEVEISIDVKASNVVVTVADNGPGVPSEIGDRIFEPFRRGDASRTRDGRGGAGLGLAMVKHISDSHGGSIGFGTTPGGGATFELSIPAVDRAAAGSGDAAL